MSSDDSDSTNGSRDEDSERAARDTATGDDSARIPDRPDRFKRVIRDHTAIGSRSVIHKYLPVIIVGFLVIAAAGGFLIYSMETAPETETQTRAVGSWAVDSSFTHGATVVNSTLTFTRGQRLEGRALYFTRVSPVLTGEYVVSHTGDAEAASGSVDLRLVVEAVDETTREGETETIVYWRESEQIDSVSVENLNSGEERRVRFEADVATLNSRVSAIEESLGASPGTSRIAIVAETELETTIADDRFVDTRSDRLAVEPDGGTYGVSTSLAESQTYQATENFQVPVEATPLQLYGGPAFAVIGLLGALVSVIARNRDLFALTQTERTYLEFTQTRSDLDKWISEGVVPSHENRTIVELSSLADLVDVAIDSDRRVVERPEMTPRYVVLDDDVRYVCDPPDAAVDPHATSVESVSASSGNIDDSESPSEFSPGADGDIPDRHCLSSDDNDGTGDESDPSHSNDTQ